MVLHVISVVIFFFFQAEDGIRDLTVTGVQTCALPISTTFIGDTDVTAPIRQFHGAADDYVTVAPCRPYFERLRAAGRDAQLVEYAGEIGRASCRGRV